MNIEKTQSGSSRTSVKLSKEAVKSLCRGETLTFRSGHDDKVFAVIGPKNFDVAATSRWIPFREGNKLPKDNERVWVTLSDNRVVAGSIDSGKWKFDISVPDSCKVIAWLSITPYRVDDQEVIDSIEEVKDSLDPGKYARVIDALNVATNRVAASRHIMKLLESIRNKETFKEIKGLFDYIQKITELRDSIGELLYESNWDEMKSELGLVETSDIEDPCR